MNLALQRPYDINIRGQTIDGNEEYTLRWRITGDISVAYRVIIKDNITDNEVYNSGKIVSYATSHVIPSDQLSNGEEYNLIIRLYDDNDNTRDSDRVVFQTSSRPVINVNSIGTVSNQSYEFTATYTQAESVSVRSYVVYLYNEQGNLISQSPIKTSSTLEHIFYSLQSERTYFVEFSATSNRGLVGTSGLIQFDVLYTQPSVNVRINAENTEDAGIKLSWDVIQIIGELVNSEEDLESLFVTDPNDSDNQFINLKQSDGIIFDEGFNSKKNFTAKFWLSDPTISETTNHFDGINLIEIRGTNGRIKVQYWQDNRFHVFKKNGNDYYHYASQEVQGSNLYLGIQQIEGNIRAYSEVLNNE